jgi:hypothetical protein
MSEIIDIVKFALKKENRLRAAAEFFGCIAVALLIMYILIH